MKMKKWSSSVIGTTVAATLMMTVNVMGGQPSFYFREVTVITTLPGGRQDVHYGESIPFDLTSWNKLVAAGG